MSTETQTSAGPCRWTYSSEPEWTWWTSCGQGFQFTNDGPTENGFGFCPYCGGQLEEVEAEAYSAGWDLS